MPIDLWVPHPGEGPVIGVVGVRYDDVLNLRAGPGTGSVVVATLDPLQDGIVGTGNGWQMPSGAVWWEVEVDGIVGWANQSFLSRMGDVLDLTSEVVAAIGLIPTAATMEELALTVACVHDPESEDCGSAPVVVVAPTVADLGEITVDVLGLADDSTAGYRLHVFGEPVDGDGFSLTAVERTLLCTRGVDDGLCI